MNDRYRLHLSEEQMRLLEEGLDDVGRMYIEEIDTGRIIETEDLDMVEILLGIGKDAANTAAARKLVAYLHSPEAVAALKARGITPKGE